jgi:hypothetical protein
MNNIAEALRLYRKHKLAEGGPTPEESLTVPEMVQTPAMAPIPLADTPITVPELSRYEAPAPAPAGESGIGKLFSSLAPLIGAGLAALADGGKVQEPLIKDITGDRIIDGLDGGMVGSFASLTNAINAKEQQSGFPEPMKQDELKNIEPDVNIRMPKGYAEGTDPVVPEGDTAPVDPTENAIAAPTTGVRVRKPLGEDKEGSARYALAQKLDTDSLRATDIDSDERNDLLRQVREWRTDSTLKPEDLQAKYDEARGIAVAKTAAKKEKLKAAAPEATTAPTPVEAAPAAPAKSDISEDAALAKRYADAGSPDAYEKYTQYKADAIREMGGLRVNPQTAAEKDSNALILRTASHIALNAADAWAAGHPASAAPATSTAAAPATEGISTTPAPVTPAPATPEAAPAPAAPAIVSTPAGPKYSPDVIRSAALAAGMPLDQATALAGQFGGTLENIPAATYEGAAASTQGAAAADLAAKLRKANADKLVVGAALDLKTRGIRDAEADAQLAAAIDTQRALAVSQANADAMRRQILADVNAADAYLHNPPRPSGWASALGILSAGLGSPQSFQDWYSAKVKDELAKQYELVGKKKGLLDLYMEQGKNLDEAAKLTEATIKRIYSAQIEKVAGGLLDAKARAEAQAASAKLGLDATKLETDVITDIATRQQTAVQARLEKQKTDVTLLKALLDIYHEEELARISAGSHLAAAREGRRAKEEEKAGPPEWHKALRGEAIDRTDAEAIGKWNDTKSAMLVPVVKIVKTSKNGVDTYTLAPSTELSVLARSPDDAKEVRAADITLGDMSRNWNRMLKAAEKAGFSKVKLASDATLSSEFEDAQRAVIAGYTQLYRTGVINGGEYDRYVNQSNPLGLTTRGEWSKGMFNSFGKSIADSLANIHGVRLRSGATEGGATPAAPKTVKMYKAGEEYDIPADKVEGAKKAGYTLGK